MKYISPANLTYLDSSYLQLCLCVKLTLRSGEVRGFTDLDVDITVSSQLYRAKCGVSVGAMRWSNKLENEKTEIEGIFSDLTGGLTEAEARKGLYNNAQVEIFLARWDTSTLIAPLKKGVLSNFIPNGAGYSAEVRSLAYPLSKKIIVDEITQECTAEFGDSRCTKTVLTYDGVITSWISPKSFIAAGFFVASGLVNGSDIVNGKLVLTGSDEDWATNFIKSFDSGTDTFVLWKPFPDGTFEGWDFTASEGCDKTFATCKDRFFNAANFRGYPHCPQRDTGHIPQVRTDDGGYVSGSGEDD